MASRAPRGFRTCKVCRTILVPNTERICEDCRKREKAKAAKAAEECKLMEAPKPAAVPSATYPGPGCGFTWEEWFAVTWRQLRRSAVRQWDAKLPGVGKVDVACETDAACYEITGNYPVWEVRE